MEENNKNNEPLNKDFKVPKLRFPEFKNVWTKRCLKSILKIKNGTDYKKVENKKGKYGVYGTGGLITHTDNFLIDKPTVCIGRKGTINRPMFFNTPIWTVDTLFYSNIKNADPRFVFYLFQTINWNKYNQSTGVPSLTSEGIEKINSFIPNSITEEKRISSFLSLIDKRINILNNKISILKKYKEGLIQQALKSTIKVPLNKLINESSNKTVTNNQYVLLSSTSKGIFLQSDFFNHQVASKNNIGYKILEEGQIVFSPQNLWLGNINLLTKYKIGCVSPSYKIFDINTKIVDSNYLIEIMRTKLFLHKYKLCSEQGASVVRRNLDLDQFLNIRVPIPSNDKFYSLLKEINYLIEKESSKLNIIISIKNYLLKNMFI